MFRSVVSMLLVGMLVGFTVAGQVTITFWHAMGRAHAPALEELTRRFMAENPGIKVELVFQGGYGPLSSKLIASVAAGEPPTIAMQYENWTTQWLDALVDLDKYLSPAVLSDIHPRHRQAFEGRTVTVPFNKSIIILYYRKDLVPVPPTTWEEFLALAEKLTVDLDKDGKIDRWGTGLRPPNPEIFLTFLAQNEGNILSEDWKKVTIADPRGLETAEYVEKLSKYALVQGGYLSDPFGLGQIAMFVDTSAGYPYNLDAAKRGGFEMGVAPLPCRRTCASMIQGTNLGIFALKQSEDQIKAAAKYIEFLLRKENTIYWARETGYLPVTTSAITSPEWLRFCAEKYEWAVMTTQFLQGGFGQLLHPNYWDMREAMIAHYERLLRGERNAAQFARELATELAGLLKK